MIKFLDGGTQIDKLYGGTGNDHLVGGWGADILFGDHGNDILFGGAHKDTLDGGDGNDVLVGEWGDDMLTGGQGADTFQFSDYSKWGGTNTITDFEDGIDVVSIKNSSLDFADLTISQDSSNALVEFGSTTINFIDFDSFNLTADDFHFI